MSVNPESVGDVTDDAAEYLEKKVNTDRDRDRDQTPDDYGDPLDAGGVDAQDGPDGS